MKTLIYLNSFIFNPIEMGIRGARSYTIDVEGTMNIMRIIIARELVGKDFLSYGNK